MLLLVEQQKITMFVASNSSTWFWEKEKSTINLT